ncbi:MAG: response regulator [Candidatus Melainabacteria bacterium]|nr:response regulator [Candidatus Melainabacteria bacterium]
MKFLIADDAGVMRKIISRALIELNALPENIVEAENGKQAVEEAHKHSFSLIFMDWNMPEMLGIDAVAAIRAAGIKSPILMVTTEGEKANVVRAIQTGATNYLVKPFSPDDIKEKITQLIGPIPVQTPQDAALAKAQALDLERGKVTLE